MDKVIVRFDADRNSNKYNVCCLSIKHLRKDIFDKVLKQIFFIF